MAHIENWLRVTTWARRQTDGTREQVDLFLACCDPAWLDRLEAKLGEIGRALRAFVREDDELARREWADTVAATALDDLER